MHLENKTEYLDSWFLDTGPNQSALNKSLYKSPVTTLTYETDIYFNDPLPTFYGKYN